MEAWFAEGDRLEAEGWEASFADLEPVADDEQDASFVARARERVSILFPFMPRDGVV